jgi:hypothetical protein
MVGQGSLHRCEGRGRCVPRGCRGGTTSLTGLYRAKGAVLNGDLGVTAMRDVVHRRRPLVVTEPER